MSSSHDTIGRRLAMILVKFNDGEKFTAKELAHEFNVSLRTIQRDLKEKLSYFPIKKENNYYSLESYALGKLSYKDIKVFATISGIKGLYPSLKNGFIADIINQKVNQTFIVKTHGYEEIEAKTKEFEQLNLAILEQHKITFEYSDKHREVNPYILVNNNGIWYLVGDENNQLKNYSFSKIAKLIILKEHFQINKEYVDIINKNELSWFSQNQIEVVLEIDNSVAEYFLRRSLFSNQTILEQTDKKLILQTKVSYDDEILSIVKYWLPQVKIIAPNTLQQKLENLLKEYLQTT